MIIGWRRAILGGGLGLYLAVVGFLGGMVLTQHAKAIHQWRSYLGAGEQKPPPRRELDDALRIGKAPERKAPPAISPQSAWCKGVRCDQGRLRETLTQRRD
jgi:hypothetical protein